MAVYTFVGNKRLEDWRVEEIVIGRNSDGSPKKLARGESADIDQGTYDYLAQRFKLVPGTGQPAEPIVDPNKGEKGDPGVAGARGEGIGFDWFEIAGHSLAGGGGSRIAPIGGFGFKTKGALGIPNWHDYSIGGAIACRPTAVTTGDGGYPWVLRNALRPGSPGQSQVQAQAPYNPQSQLVVSHFGLNDLGILGAAKPLPWQTALRTILARFCAAAVFEDDNAAWTYTGAWSGMGVPDASASSSGIGIKYTSTVGDKASFAVPADFPAGRVVGIGIWLNAAWGPVTYGVKIDGVNMPDLTLNPVAMTDQFIANMHIVHTLRIGTGIPGDPYGALLGAGAHTVELTLKSGSNLAIDFSHIEADPLDGPLLACPLPNKPANYSIWTSWPGGPSMTDAVVDTWKDYERAILAEFPGRVISDSHGLGIDLDDANLIRVAGGTGDFISDGAHPNDRGHGKWTELLAKVIRESPLVTDRIRSRPFVDPRPRAWKKVGAIAGGGAFLVGWSNFGNAALPDFQWRVDEKRRVFVKGTLKAATGATTSIVANGTFPKPAAIASKPGAVFDGTTWGWMAMRHSNLGAITRVSAGAASIAAGNIHEFDYDYQAEI